MRLKALFGASVVGIALALAGAGSASAATEIGDRCTAEGATQGYTLTQLQAAAGRSLTAPVSGVVTQWGANFAPLPIPSLGMHLAILHPTGNPDEFTTSAESAAGPIQAGENSFQTRLPISAGDRLGTTGTGVAEVVLYCPSSDASDALGAVAGGAPVGSTHVFPGVTQARLAAWAKIEPDADNDGFGDETQDQCPQSAALQTPCPVAVLSVSSVIRKGFARVLVTSNTQASVKVAGRVKLGKGKKAKLSGSTQVVVPGTIAKFTLIFPAGVKSKLKELTHKQSLQLVLKATAQNVAAGPTVRTLKAKLKGQKKPLRKGKRG